ncbi:MAG: hypothetical protein PHE43_00940 [Candidatus Nanoarchaeia archaeon]|nr:hypothetical protein [Candidatus Nanoarchaeia archaeon]
MNKRGLMTLKFLILLILGIIVTLVVATFLTDLYKTLIPDEVEMDSATDNSFNDLYTTLKGLEEGKGTSIPMQISDEYTIYAKNKFSAEGSLKAFDDKVIEKNIQCKELSCICVYNTEEQKFMVCKVLSYDFISSGVVLSNLDDLRPVNVKLESGKYSVA